MEILIIKRDGSKEGFKPEKIKRVVEAAGLSNKNSKKLVSRLESWVTNSKAREISTLSVRDKVIEELKTLDSYAANMFQWYQKTKDNVQD